MNKKSLKNITLIIGCGRFGASIARKYDAMGKAVVVVDHDKTHFALLEDTFSGFEVHGDVKDLAILEEAHINKAKEIIVCTGNDNVNIFVSHVARRIFDVENIYVRLKSYNKKILIEDMKIKGIYPSQLTVNEFENLKEND